MLIDLGSVETTSETTLERTLSPCDAKHDVSDLSWVFSTFTENTFVDVFFFQILQAILRAFASSTAHKNATPMRHWYKDRVRTKEWQILR